MKKIKLNKGEFMDIKEIEKLIGNTPMIRIDCIHEGIKKSIYTKKLQAESQNKKIGAVDERFLQKAEDLLFGELAVALEIPKEKVLDYISEKLN